MKSINIIFLSFLFLFISVVSFDNKVSAGSCSVQGQKYYYSDNKELDGTPAPSSITNAEVSTLNQVNLVSSANPYSLTVTDGSYNVSVSVPSGYDVGYTLCYNSTDCHSGIPIMKKTVAVTCQGSGYIDLWWHYKKLGDIDNNKIVSMSDLLSMLRALFL